MTWSSRFEYGSICNLTGSMTGPAFTTLYLFVCLSVGLQQCKFEHVTLFQLLGAVLFFNLLKELLTQSLGYK